MTIDEAITKLKAAPEKAKRIGTQIIDTELRKAVKLNFIEQGRPNKWAAKKRPDGRAILTGKTGNGQRSINFETNESTGENKVGSKLIYMKAHQEGAVIKHSARSYSFRKKRSGKYVYANKNYHKISKTTHGKAYTVTLRPRPWAVWTDADTKRTVPLLEKAALGVFN